MLDLNCALLIFVIAVVAIFVVMRSLNVKFFSSLVLALLTGYLLLITIRPWNTVEGFVDGNLNALIYLVIAILIPIIVAIYVIYKAFTDRISGCE